jgi:PAS domain S-box-containing protein/putative nucleotidyltransferase with HDIG domain
MIIKRRKQEKTEPTYKDLVEKAGSSIVIDDREGNFIYFNKNFADLFEYSIDEMKKQTIRSIVYPDDVDMVLSKHKDRVSGKTESSKYEFKGITKNGSLIYLEVFTFPHKEGNKILGTQSYLWDITARKQTELDLRTTLATLRKMTGGAIQAIHRMIEIRDPYTGLHQRRTADLARTIAHEMNLPLDTINGIRMAGLIHDIGKIAIPAEILSKPTRLTEVEYFLIKSHPFVGYQILESIDFPWPIAQIVLQHHERLDGSGYPNGLIGDKIIIGARILGVADVIEAMASHRPYRAALGLDAALEEISGKSGSLYDPAVAKASLRLFKEGLYQFSASSTSLDTPEILVR